MFGCEIALRMVTSDERSIALFGESARRSMALRATRALVTPGVTEEEQKLNAKYAISSARKLGCTLFLLWEDIVEVRPKMLLSFMATVMATAHASGAA